jgi:hypothetical protein
MRVAAPALFILLLPFAILLALRGVPRSLGSFGAAALQAIAPGCQIRMARDFA